MSTEKKPKVYFIGIGGIGMSALARWFKANGWAVLGSDIEKSSITDELVKDGIRVKIGHKSGNINKDIILVIYNQAITKESLGYREFVQAKKLNIALLSYPEAIGGLTKKYKTITVSGAHGKSTTTALLSTILLKNKIDPTIIIGTKLKELNGSNFHSGKSPYFLLEADEWRAALLHYTPYLAIITNIDREHLDFYKNLTHIKNTFLKFLSGVQNSGILVLNQDDKNLLSLKSKIQKLAKKKNLKVYWYSLHQKEARSIRRALKIPGIHNVSNGLAALTAARTLGVSERGALTSLSKYGGAWRRMEYRGKYLGFDVLDDYGHHPTEIKATLQALREKYPKEKLVCVFQPHQAERLKLLFKEFQDAFSETDIALILPIYQVAGRDEKPSGKYDSAALVKAIQKRQPKKLIFYLENPDNLRKALQVILSKPGFKRGGIVLMGAGNIVKYTDSLLN